MSAIQTLPPQGRWRAHASETLAIATPIAIAGLAQMGMAITDAAMLGGIGERALAAGGLAANLFFTLVIALQATLGVVGVLAARARGAGDPKGSATAYWSGLAVAAALSVAGFLIASRPGALLRLAGEPEELAGDVAAYLHVLRWAAPASLMGMGMMRAFLPALGLQRVLLWVIPAGVVMNAALNWQLIHGGFGLPGFGFLGSAAATATTVWATGLALTGVLFGRRRWRAQLLPPRPRWRAMREIVAVGLPVSGASLLEGALFLATGLVAGTLGAEVLAAHTVAITVASVTFMPPFAIAQAASVRVAAAAGAGRPAEAREAGLAAIGLAAAAMAGSALAMIALPDAIASLFLDPDAAAASAALAASLLRVSAMFQLADGVQVAAAGALRGLKDTRVPLLLAAIGYWGIGFWSGRWLAFDGGMGARGLWLGLFAGLTVSASGLTARFLWTTRGQRRHGIGG